MAVVTVNAACGGYRPVPEFDPGELKKPHALEGTPLTRLWRARPVRGPSDPVAIDTLNAYIAGSDRRIAAVDLTSGKTRWSVRLTGPLVGGVVEQGNLVFTASDQPGGKVVALRKESGREVWSAKTGYVQAPMALTDGMLAVVTRTGLVVGVNVSNGKVAWKKRLPSTRVPPTVVDSGVVMVTSFDSLYRVRLKDGQVLLRRRSPGAVTSPWLWMGSTLLAGTGDSTVVALSPDSLREVWHVRLDAPLLVSPAAQGDTVFCVTRAGSIYRIVPGADPTESRIHAPGWPATGTPALVGPWILIGGADGSLYGFDRETGEQRWKVALGRPAESPVYLLNDGSFLAVGGAGDLHRITR